MDPNIMKILEEDEDESMHSGADLDAFTAELNRDIEGNTSILQPLSDSDRAVLSHENSENVSQFHQQWQASDHNESSSFQREQDLFNSEQKDKHLSKMELKKDLFDSGDHKEEDISSRELKTFHLPMSDSSLQQQNDQNIFPASQPLAVQTSGSSSVHVPGNGSEPHPERESELQRLRHTGGQQSMSMGSNNHPPSATRLNDLQTLPTGTGNQLTESMGISNGQAMAMKSQHGMETGTSNQQAMNSEMNNQQSMNQQSGSTMKLNKQVPFGMLLPIIQPQLDKERAAQLYTLYFKLKKNEISKDGFVRHMRSIVGDQMLKMAVYKLQTQAARNVQTSSNQHHPEPQASGQQLPVTSNDIRNSGSSNIVKSHAVESQGESQGFQGLTKQQHPHLSQTSFPSYGSSANNHSHFSATNVTSSTSIRPQLHDSQTSLPPAHQSLNSSNIGVTTQNMNAINMPKFERPPSVNDPKKTQVGALTQLNNSSVVQQNLGEWPSSSSREPKYGVSSSMIYAKQEPIDQSSELQQKPQLNSSQGLSALSSPQNLGNYRGPLKKPLVGQKKPMETPGSSPPSGNKKQKVSGAFSDQSIEQLNDVTAVSGVNLREEEEQLFSGSKEDMRISEASRRAVQEEEERLILHKIPLQKKVVEIMAKCGLKNMSIDVERCLSLSVEERMRGLITNLIRLSKQRVDMEKPRHGTVITSDIRQQINSINRKAREEWEKKQAETDKSQKLNETESESGIDGDKDENRLKLAKANKDEDDKMRTTAANVAVRAATGVGDMLSRWQLMIEAKQKQGGGTETLPSSQPSKDAARKPLPTSTRNARENQEAEKRDRSVALNTPSSVRKVGKNQVVVPPVARSISVKDMIAVLERDPHMSKSMLTYRLYNKPSNADAITE